MKAFNTAFELDVTRIKIGDGWHNIWLTVEKGVMTVGPSRIYTRSTPDITASYQDYTLIEVMYAFVYSAIVSKRGNVDQKNLILLDEEVEEAKDLRLHQSALFGFKDIRPAAAPGLSQMNQRVRLTHSSSKVSFWCQDTFAYFSEST